MTNWIETYRGTVPPWQCDVTEHFTVAYYFDRVEEAEGNLRDTFGLGDLSRGPGVPRRLDVRLVKELRAGASFHIESAAIALDETLRLGHRFIDSASGETVSWFDERWDLSATPLPPEQNHAIRARLAPWTGPDAEARPEPTTTDGLLATARGQAKPGDLDACGHFSLSAMIHRFSNASGQTAAALGMDTGAMQRLRRGFSTFEMKLRVSGPLHIDEPYLIETGIGLLGNSSLRMIHRMTNPRTGAEIARLSQFGVNLDLDARRPTGWPDDVREKAKRLIVPVA